MKQSFEGWLTRGALVVVLALGVVGCSTYKGQNKIAQHWQASNLAMAEKEASTKANKKADSKDSIIWRLEEAAVLRAAGKLQESNKSFDQAEERINKYAEEAKTKLGNEAGALRSNQANLPYRGRAYDGIMLNTYKAMNYLQLGDPDKARVELIRAYQRQQDAVEDNKKQIEKTQDAVAKQKAADKQKIEKAQENAKFKSEMDSSYGDLDKLKAYGDYVNPFTVYLDGLFFMASATGPSDLERARKDFERASSFASENKFVKADLEAMDGVLQGKAIPPTTYVIFETGCAPIRDQIRIDIPIVVTSVSYVGAAFPKLKPQEGYAPSLNVAGTGCSETTALLCSMDSVIGLDFKNELPTIIAKTLASTIIKAAAATAINEAARQQSSEAWLASKLITAGAQAAVNIADLRTWTTLPKEFQVCRIATPEDRKIEISTPSGQKMPVTIADGTYNIVYVKNISGSGPLLMSQMKLK